MSFAALVLVALTWMGTRDAIRAHRAEAHARVQAEMLGKAQAFEEQLRRELLSLDQTLRILEYEFERDPTNFDLATRARQVVVLNDVSLQLFIVDAQGIVRASTRPAIVGTDVSGRDYFRHESGLARDDGAMFVGSLTQGQITKLWQINLVRRLDNATGSFDGVIAASYDTNSFTRFYRDVDLGSHGLIAVVSVPDGEAWTMSDAAQPPTVVSTANGPILAAMQGANEGIWEGRSMLDDADRIYAFATVPGRNLKLAVGIDRAEAMSDSVAWEQNALIYASGITDNNVLLGGGAAAARGQRCTAASRTALTRARRSGATLTGMSDGIMMVDGDLRLAGMRTSTFRNSPACRRRSCALACRWRISCAARWPQANSGRSMSRPRSRDAWRCCAPALHGQGGAGATDRTATGDPPQSAARRGLRHAASSSRSSPPGIQTGNEPRQAQTMAAVGWLTRRRCASTSTISWCRSAAMPRSRITG